MAASRKLLFRNFFIVSSFLFSTCVYGNPNYSDALAKSILFFQGQRSGWLPPDQKITWRSNSGLSDGSAAKVDLVGGYYDAGDNVKFGFPMAFTTTMLSWSVIEYRDSFGPQLGNAMVAIRWATDYFLKAATQTPGKLYVGVGNPYSDHQCWERPEDMDTPRNVYSVSASNPGSDVAGETAAALAAASIVFQAADPAYSKRLLSAAKNVMDFAAKHLGRYSDSLGGAVNPFYTSYSGYKDELLWGASWLLKATNDTYYKNYLYSLGANDNTDFFSWDDKFAGARVLLSKRVFVDKDKSFDSFRIQAENFMCRILPNSPSSTTHYTRGGLMYKLDSSNLQYVTAISFLLTTYSKYISSNHTFNCGKLWVNANILKALAKKQVDYILGDNPMKMSYMVGFGSKFPQRIHHRGASLPSKASYPAHIGCQAGFQYFNTWNPNPNTLTGAVVGGPDRNDAFSDNRMDYSHCEPTTYINAPLVGLLASLVGS